MPVQSIHTAVSFFFCYSSIITAVCSRNGGRQNNSLFTQVCDCKTRCIAQQRVKRCKQLKSNSSKDMYSKCTVLAWHRHCKLQNTVHFYMVWSCRVILAPLVHQVVDDLATQSRFSNCSSVWLLNN